MRWLAGRLILGSGRGEVVRFGLVALGAALAAGLLLAAAVVLAVPGAAVGRYRSTLLDEAGLRPGVSVALVLLLIPVVVLLAMTARVAAVARTQRLTALRLAGAAPGQVRGLAALDSAVPAIFGALVGSAAFGVVKGLVEHRYLSGSVGLRRLPTDVTVPLLVWVVVPVLVTAVAAASSALGWRTVITSPLGVSRSTTSPQHVRAGARVGLLAVLARSDRAVVLLATRQLLAYRGTRLRAVAGVLLAVLAATCAEVWRSGTLRGDPDSGLFTDAYATVELGLLVAVLLAGVGLAIAAVEGVLERRRTFHSLWLAGVPARVLRQSVLLTDLLVAVPGLVLATVGGVLVALPFTGAPAVWTVPWLRLLGVFGVGLIAVLLSSLVSAACLRLDQRLGDLHRA